MNRLQAMKDRQIKVSRVDEEAMLLHFPNGITLPITAWLAPDRKTEVDAPVDGGWAAFGSDKIGWGYYPVVLISEDEWRAEQQRQ